MVDLRKAELRDADFIARMILIALHIDLEGNETFIHHMKELVEDEGTLYHWSRCVIATAKGKNVGLCLAYDGKDYHQRRVRSFSFVCSDGEPVAKGDNTSLLQQPDESGVGEWYVDSLAVIPEYRGRGIGRILISDAVNRGFSNELMPSILVDPDNLPAVKLYESVGYKYHSKMFVFGQIYNKMTCIK